METFSVSLYICGCGYKTTNKGNACRHKKVSCGHEMNVSAVRMVLETDYLEAIAKASAPVVQQRDHNVNHVDQSTTNNITNINLVLPERTTKEDFIEFLETLNGAGYRSPEQIMAMPGKLLTLVRDPKKYPGAIVERNNKIVEKLPDGKERVMAKKKAVQTYTNEAVESTYGRFPHPSVPDFLEKERGNKRKTISVLDSSKLRVNDPPSYHNKVPEEVKHIQKKMENDVEKALDTIVSENERLGFL